MERFICENCGSTELIYDNWVRCRKKVIIQSTGFIEYFDQNINVDDILPAEYRFICGSCGKSPMLYGNYITDEAELIDYLNLTAEEKAEMQEDYEKRADEQARPEPEDHI